MSSKSEKLHIEKSDRQVRTEKLARQMRDDYHRPIVIEFAGLPKAGKSTTLSSIQMFLKRCGFKTEILVEGASVCPIKDKKHAHFNVWTTCTALSQILERTQDPPRADDPQVLFLDRGIFDAICWFRVMEQLCRVRAEDREKIESFLRLKDWRSKVSGVVFMTANPDDALDRERGLLEVIGSPGSIMNMEVLAKLKDIYDQAACELKEEFNVIRVDTSLPELSNPRSSAEYVLDKALDMIELELEEKILYIPMSEVDKIFGSSKAVADQGAAYLTSQFEKMGAYGPRGVVEADAGVVQALPVVVVRKKSGDILLLLRKEANYRNALHRQNVIWAGGHVREEDGPEDPIPNCAVRELEEELRISLNKETLRLVCAIYDKSNDRSICHVAIVYEWRAPSDDIAIAISKDEFFERHGTSLTGEFLELRELAKKVDRGDLKESWSVSIADFLISGENIEREGRLL